VVRETRPTSELTSTTWKGLTMPRKPVEEPKLTVSVTVRVWPNESKVLGKLSRMQRLSRSQVLRRALEAYARSALSFSEYRALYPVE
jgi:hypothetical protein